MRRAYIWFIVGLIVFVTVYALVFPDSQLPMRAKVDFVAIAPMIDGIALDDFIVSDDTVYLVSDGVPIEIGFPDRPELPAKLAWEQPVSSVAKLSSGKVVFQFQSGKKLVWDGTWSHVDDSDIAEIAANQDEMISFDKSRFKKVPKIHLVSHEVFLNYGDRVFSSDLNSGKIVWEEAVEQSDISETDSTKIGEYSFEIKDDGRIVRLRDDIITAISDRTSLSPFVVPTKLATDGKSLFSLLSSTSYDFIPEFWVQVLDKSLVPTSQIVKARNGILPVSANVWRDDILLVLWNDGILSAYTLWGQEIAKFHVCKNPKDMVTSDEKLLILTGSELVDVTLTLREPGIVVWPRVADIGRINLCGSEFDIHVVSDEIPNFQIKGDGVTLFTIVGEEGGYTATFKIAVNTLGAFVEQNGEIIIETQSGHEIVPFSFTPFGDVRKLKKFTAGLLDEQTGEFFDYIITDTGLSIPELERKKSSTSSIFWDELSDCVFVLSPSAGLPLDLLTNESKGP